jgi:hypothetical protein
VQNVLECVKSFTGGLTTGCSGGNPLSVWKYARDKNGLPTEASYGPYTGDPSEACDSSVARMPQSKVDFWQQLPDEEAMKCRVALYGPVLSAMKIKGTFIRRYKSGIWSDPRKTCASVSDDDLDHSVMIVGKFRSSTNRSEFQPFVFSGYGTEPNRKGVMTDYWIVQNSWGSDFGELGTFRIARNKNLCGIGANGWFVASKPQREYPLAPVEPPAFCVEGGDVVKSDKYEKSLCVIEFAQSYENSRSACIKYGMRLFKLDSFEANSTLFSFALEKYSKFMLSVNGRSDAGCTNVNNIDGSMRVETLNCENLGFGACEYIKVPGKLTACSDDPF